MVSMGVSKLGPMDMMFIDARVKINGAYYRELLLTQKLMHCLSCVRTVASSLSSSKAMFLLTEYVGQSSFWNETPAFIATDLLPSNSTDLNPVHYRNMRINATVGIASSWCVDELKQCLIDVWHHFEQSVVDNSIDQWRKWLCAWICVKWRHFKHLI